MHYRLRPISNTGTIMLVGCGGTGGFVAEGLCRLLGKKRTIILVDHDKVEERNIGRQNFYESDLGRFKSRVLAERLVWQFGTKIEYSTERIENLTYGWRGLLTIGCVDSHVARQRLEIGGEQMGFAIDYSNFGGWYIDAGNGAHHGQVLIGNSRMKRMKEVFLPDEGICDKLPLPTIQQPALLVPEARPHRNNCARAVARDEQSPVINRIMADLVLNFVYRLLAGKLTWMGVYIDLEAGTMNAVVATPEAVARITGQKVRNLEYRPRRRA